MKDQEELIVQYIKTHLHNTSLNGETIAQHLGMSRMQLHRNIKKLKGMNSGELIREIRIETSKQLIQSTNMSITEISKLVGFKDVSYFTKVFKSICHYTPSYYRVEK